MSKAVLLRPGSLIGSYPQREDYRDSWLERLVDNISGMLRQYGYAGKPDYRRFISQVNRSAEGLDQCSLEALKSRASDLRKNLYSQGLETELVAESFALIREITTRLLGMTQHDVQLYGGWVMLQGMVAEMETGEGKTLTATLPACTAALAGIPVHVVTVNDFLVKRDAKWMEPIYRFFGLSVGVVTEEMNLAQRREAYASDITYCSNKQLAFDYLKDRLLLEQENRHLHLQLEGLYNPRPRTSRLLMRGLCFAIVDEADSVLIDEARTPLIISNTTKLKQEEETYRYAIKIARRLSNLRDFVMNFQERKVKLTDAGRAQVRYLTRGKGGIWEGPRRSYDLISQALAALHLYQLDKHYLIKDNKVQIIDEYTGRVMADRAWERGLHQMMEAKEGCPISGGQETLARISYQKFFRRYLRLAGMTGTAREVSRELASVYRLNVVRIPTNRPVMRKQWTDRVYVDAEQKWAHIVGLIRQLHEEQRPVLIGTKSVASSEYLSELLTGQGLPHQVLNARQDQEEAQIIAQAGQAGRITVATNMAGRGTDIRLSPGVDARGGLHVLASERHEARRIDRQLYGRGGRQGDAGSFHSVVSLEDDILLEFYGSLLTRLFKTWRGPLPGFIGSFLVKLAQLGSERHHSRLRRELLKQDDRLSDMLAFTGRGE
ncbi:MAG: preprotein translocase subunit SecA [Gammaproteobacteria bacterium]|nr:preprotein translocase subunit SecA [Gammaproteobacteria bacterium]